MVKATYHELTPPLNVVQFAGWLSNYLKNNNVPSPFTKDGTGKQQYMCGLDDTQAIFLLREAIKIQQNSTALQYLSNALAEIVDDMNSEYDQVEKEAIEELVGSGNAKPTYSAMPEPPIMMVSVNTGRPIPKRDPVRAANALANANYQCEYDPTHRTFLRKNGTPYTEPHHLIPISKYRDFAYNVDREQNIVSLCSHCHNLLHYGRFQDKQPMLQKLYNARISALRKCGLDLTLQDLEKYYK